MKKKNIADSSASIEAIPMLVAGELDKGKHFRLRKNGKVFTVHEHAISKKMNGLPSESGDMYVLAVSRKVMYAVDFHCKVIACH